jgi:peptidyl-prolyl cis-trans isomerase C
MMNLKTMRFVAPLALVVLLGGCGLVNKIKGGGTPKGQVVATVDGKEITLTELQTEIGGPLPGDPKAAQAVQQAVLQRIIARDVMADAAHDQKLDQGPAFAIQMARAKKDLMASLLQRKMAADVPPPTRDEAEQYVSEHPTMFGQRKLLVVEQVQAQRFNDPNLMKALAPIKTLEEVESLLDSRSLLHQRTIAVLDGLRTDPRLMEQIDKLPPGELFVVPAGNALTINQIHDQRTMPFTGPAAIEYAMRALRDQRSREAVSKQGQAMLKSAQSKVKYGEGYKPPEATSPQVKG